MSSEEGDLDRDTGKMEAEMGEMELQAKEAQRGQPPPGVRREKWYRPSLRACRRKQQGCHVEFGLLASRTVRECILVASQSAVICYSNPIIQLPIKPQ